MTCRDKPKDKLEETQLAGTQKISTGMSMSTGRRLQWTPPELSRSHIRAGARPETKASSRGVLRRWQMNVNKQAISRNLEVPKEAQPNTTSTSFKNYCSA
jgi:hypothetical protein